MAIFKLQINGNDLSSAELVHAPKTNLKLEEYLEGWLEQSPWAIAEETILIIGRQTTAVLEEKRIIPDLLGLDSEGNIVIIELKKGKARREVVAQLLEYAAWANDLSDIDIHEIAERYFASVNQLSDKTLTEVFCDTFDTGELPSLNQKLRMFIAAEEIEDTVSSVCRFLRTVHGVDVSCVEFSVYQTESGERLVNSRVRVGDEDAVPPKKTISERWSGDMPAGKIVQEAVSELTQGNKKKTFSINDIQEIILRKYSGFKRNTIVGNIVAHCVNHNSRHHHPQGEDLYWFLERGKYQLYDPKRHTTSN